MSNIGEKIKCRKCNGEGSYRSSFSPGLRRPPNIPCELCKGSGMEPLTSTEGNLEQAMNNETDLDWLARNVHVWHPLRDLAVVQHADVDIYVTWPSACSDGITKAQWLARRAELQNKPSWGAVPSHANWLAQDAAGSWLWHSSEPECRNGGWIGSTTRGYAAKGCVLGEWRDTLEKRPADLSESAVTERLQEATDNVLAAVPELKSDKYKFDQIISIEDNQELSMTKQQEVKQDNRWFERGELPPVGVECEAKKYGKEEWYKVVIYGAGKHLGLAVAFYEKQKGSGAFTCSSAEYFRPIRTEREVAIKEMQSDIAERWANCEELAKYLVEKGWVKAGK